MKLIQPSLADADKGIDRYEDIKNRDNGMAEGAKQANAIAPRNIYNGRFANLDPDKLRGGYYTSAELTTWLCRWAVRSSADRVLEPSCGDGSFLQAAMERFLDLGASGPSIASQLKGIEIVSNEADKARGRLNGKLGSHAADVVRTEDFFGWWQWNGRVGYDAVIGNPPFIRYQSFPEPHRSRAMEIMASLGLRPNRLTNIWVPFVAAAAARLNPGGRLALVLPAELLQVSYASQLRGFLTDRFARIDIVACNELFFDRAEQEVVLLLADGALAEPSSDNVCRVSLIETPTVADITGRSPDIVLAGAVPKTIHHDHEKWLKYFLSEIEISFMRELRESAAVTSLSTHAHVNVGVVTGKNEFFVLNSAQVERFGLAGYTVPLVSRSVQLKGAHICVEEWQTLTAGNDRVHLLHLAPLNGATLPAVLADYVRAGEEMNIHKGYKCSIRTPWYEVPSVSIPDSFLFRQIYDFPRPVLNRAGATSTDTIHRMKCKSKPEAVITNLYSHLTAASAEIEGRSYGGGVLELEPTEAERLLVPVRLGAAMPIEESDRLIRAGRLTDVLAENDRLVLQEGLGLSASDCVLLRGIWIKMRDRRGARRRGTRRVAVPSIAEELS